MNRHSILETPYAVHEVPLEFWCVTLQCEGANVAQNIAQVMPVDQKESIQCNPRRGEKHT